MRTPLLAICVAALPTTVGALSIEPNVIGMSTEEAKAVGIEVVVQLENRQCRYGPSIEMSAPREFEGNQLLSAYLAYEDGSASVIFLEDGAEGKLCPNRWNAALVLEYGGGATDAVFLKIVVELPRMDRPYNKSVKYVPGLSALHRTQQSCAA